MRSAEAYECAALQGRHIDYHDILFANFTGHGSGAYDTDNLKDYAVELGLDSVAFDECLDKRWMLEYINSDLSEGKRSGVRATPTLFIDGNEIRGARDYRMYAELIDLALAKNY